jgi:hypothetical protein
VLERLTVYDSAQALDACVLEEPRHVILFEVRGHTAVVMNQLFDIDWASAKRVAAFTFRSAGA